MLCWYDPVSSCFLLVKKSVQLLVSSLLFPQSDCWCQFCPSRGRCTFVRAAPTVHRGGVMLQDALCCSSGLFQQVLIASAGCSTVPLYVLVSQWIGSGGWTLERRLSSIDSLPHSGFVLFICILVCPLSSVIKLSSLHVLSWPQRQVLF